MNAVGDVAGALKRTSVLQIVPQENPSGFDAIPATRVLAFRSEADLTRWLSAGGSPAINAVLYDTEDWQFTPVSEQQDPLTYATAFVKTARQHGLTPILAPAMDLSRVLAPGAASNSAGYLQVRLPAQMAQALAGGPGYIVVQSQSLERTPGTYAGLIRSAMAQVVSQDSQATVLGGISTNPTGGAVSSTELLQDLQLTSSLVAGYWLNVPTPGPACPDCGPANPSLGLQVLQSS
jgi:hypothetical protein